MTPEKKERLNKLFNTCMFGRFGLRRQDQEWLCDALRAAWDEIERMGKIPAVLEGDRLREIEGKYEELVAAVRFFLAQSDVPPQFWSTGRQKLFRLVSGPRPEPRVGMRIRWPNRDDSRLGWWHGIFAGRGACTDMWYVTLLGGDGTLLPTPLRWEVDE